MNKNFKAGAQGGFTLIELIVVIVILGILAATALPKFINLGGDARFASVNAAKGAIAATSAMLHSKALVNPTLANADVPIEGGTATLANGYPTSGTLALAAGLSATDYKLTVNGRKLTVSPISVSAANVEKCNVSYDNQGLATGPIIIVTAAPDDCV